MLDTKVINVLTDTSSQTCYLCGCKPTEMNNLDQVRNRNVNTDNLEYGLSTLHAWIKFLECILHIAYKLEIKKYSLRGTSEEEKKMCDLRKKEIQETLWKSIGIKVDKVVQGSGTSNTGNVARRFFKNADEAAAATGIDKQLISKFSTILQVYFV